MTSKRVPRLLEDVLTAIRVLGKPTSPEIISKIRTRRPSRQRAIDQIYKALWYAESSKQIINKKGKFFFPPKNQVTTHRPSGNICPNCSGKISGSMPQPKKDERKDARKKLDLLPDKSSSSSEEKVKYKNTPNKRTGKDKRFERRQKGQPKKIGRQVKEKSTPEDDGAEENTSGNANMTSEHAHSSSEQNAKFKNMPKKRTGRDIRYERRHKGRPKQTRRQVKKNEATEEKTLDDVKVNCGDPNCLCARGTREATTNEQTSNKQNTSQSGD